MTLLDEIQRARRGEIITIPFIHKKLSKYAFIGQGMYHLLGGAGGSGKSAWVDQNYAINPALWFKKLENKNDLSLKIILRSLERSKEKRKAKWVCMYLYINYGILMDTASLLGWGVQKSKVTDELFEKIVEAYNWVESLLDIVEIVDGIENPTGIYKHFRAYALSIGTLYQYEKQKGGEEILLKYRGSTKVKANIKETPKDHKGNYLVSPYQPVYVLDNPKHITLGIVDHLQAMKKERGFSDKENLDKMSEYARVSRDVFKISPIMVSQLNRGISDTFRRVKTDLLPEDSDFSGSSNMYNDCDLAGILFNPFKYKVNNVVNWIPTKCISDYGINRFRSWHILKNTYGPDNQIFGYQFLGENGIFNEMPAPKEMNEAIYERISNPPHKQLIVRYTEPI
jgi:hypothetical protein